MNKASKNLEQVKIFTNKLHRPSEVFVTTIKKQFSCEQSRNFERVRSTECVHCNVLATSIETRRILGSQLLN